MMYRVALILQAHETLKALEVKFCNQVNPFLAFYGFTPHIVTLKQEYNDNAQETSNSLLRQCKCVDYKLFLKEFKGMPKRLVWVLDSCHEKPHLHLTLLSLSSNINRDVIIANMRWFYEPQRFDHGIITSWSSSTFNCNLSGAPENSKTYFQTHSHSKYP